MARWTLALACFALACSREDDPATWAKRLDDPARRAEAISRLEAFAGDAGARADAIAAPLAATYVRGGLDDRTRAGILDTLVAMHDERAEPAFAAALDACGADAERAARGLAELARAKKTVAAPAASALFSCFVKPARPDDAAFADAVAAVRDASYPTKAAALLSAPVNPADSFDARGVHKTNDELVRQTRALGLLARMPDEGATRALVTVLMTREKRTLWPLARVALAKTPRASEKTLASALDGSDPAFVALRGAWARDDGYVPNLVEALADVGLDSARDAVLAAVASLGNDANRTAAAEALVWFSSSPELVAAYRATYAKLPPIAIAKPRDTGFERSALLQAAADLFDPSLLSWLLDESKNAKGEELTGAKAGAIQSAIKLMQPGDERRVEGALDDLEHHSGLSRMEAAEVGDNLSALERWAARALTQCKADVACHLAILDEPIPSDSHANWKLIKAATMCGLLGDDATRAALVARVPKVKNPGVRMAMARAIDHLAPKGSAADASALETVAASESLGPDDPIPRVARILRARSAP